jgi:hypothetical protein
VDGSLEYINRSQNTLMEIGTEAGNSQKGINKWDFHCSVDRIGLEDILQIYKETKPFMTAVAGQFDGPQGLQSDSSDLFLQLA